MTARTHDLASFASLVTIASFYPPAILNLPTFLASLVGNIIGGVLPDIDQASNRLWDLLPSGDMIGRVLKNILLSHRSLSHSLIGFYLFYRLLDWILPKFLNPEFLDLKVVLLSIMVGFASHLFLDFFTEEGIPLFFPFKAKLGFPPIASWRIKTGGWFEKYIVFLSIFGYLVWFVVNNQIKIISILRLAINHV